jgi:hypothetical protein
MSEQKKMGRPTHTISPEVVSDTQDMLMLDRFLSVPAFAEYNCVEYTREQIITSILAYVLTGSSRKASQASGIKDGTIRKWKCRDVWWTDCVAVAREVISEKLEDKFTALLNTTLSQLSQRLEKGDRVVTKDGHIVDVPLKAGELTRLLGALFDRRQLIRGDVTSRSETRTTGKRLDELRQAAESVIRNANNAE